MAFSADRVKEATTTTGAGDLTLAGAATGFRTFNAAAGLNRLIYYVIIDADGVNWECGMGYLSTSTNFVRATVHDSTNSNAAISLSAGLHTVFSTLTESGILDLYSRIYMAAAGIAVI